MVIQCGCLDMMRAEDGKLHSQLEWPNGVRRFSADLVQGGLEVPCCLVFQGSTRDIDKIRQMLQDALKEQQKAPEVKQEVEKNEEDQ